MTVPAELSELEVEILGCLSMGPESTTMLDQEMLDSSPGQTDLQRHLADLVDRGFLTTARAVGSGPRRDGLSIYEDDHWTITARGRRAVSLHADT